jgi:hypothetical protein
MVASAQGGDLPSLFAAHDPLEVTLVADFERLKQDRTASPDRLAIVSVVGPDGGVAEIAAELRTRGAFRLDPAHCSFPPLRLDVDGSDAAGTVFDGQDDLKIVSSCRPGRASYDEAVVTEYLAYRAYALLTDRSYRVRPARLTFIDTSGTDPAETRLGFFIEDDEALAARHGSAVFDLEAGRNLPASAFDPATTTMTAVFEYMIGNTDWSDVAGHNVQIFDRGGVALAVPYDFDFSGLVDAPYATADPDFGLRSVRERYYRGWCASAITTSHVLARFREARAQVRGLYEVASGVSEETRIRILAYLDEFYDTIETDERAERRFLRDCRLVER